MARKKRSKAKTKRVAKVFGSARGGGKTRALEQARGKYASLEQTVDSIGSAFIEDFRKSFRCAPIQFPTYAGQSPDGENHLFTLDEPPRELDILIRRLVAWRSLGHGFSCQCHNCIPLRQEIAGFGSGDGLYLADRYPLRYGVKLDSSFCRHNVDLVVACSECEVLWERGEEKPFPYCYATSDSWKSYQSKKEAPNDARPVTPAPTAGPTPAKGST